jgi:glycosyltransferase involved in cell wall biosynthesis
MQASPNPLPGVSVVIPAYNYARFVSVAIESVLAQTYPVTEVIVVDDGSTDNTREVVAAYLPHVRYLHQANAGLPAARNAGIRAASHPFVAFLDADDKWMPDMLAKNMTAFESLPDEFALVACRDIFVGAPGAPLNNKMIAPADAREITVRDLLLMTRFSPSAVVAKRAVFEECGYFDPALRSSEDRDMWIRIATRRRLMLIGDILVQVLKHGGSMSRNCDRMRQSMAAILHKAWVANAVPQGERMFWRKVRAFTCYQEALLLNVPRRREALWEILRSIWLWPFFTTPRELNEPWFFRLRSAMRFFLPVASVQPAVQPVPLLAPPLAGGTSVLPGVSVVIPTYNYGHFLAESIESALNQTYPNIEVIVVDDGSTDHTRQVVEKYLPRVRYLHQSNAGVSAARNTGLRAATHPFVSFLDADDKWLPNMLAKMMATFAQLPDEFAVVACQAVRFGQPGQVLNNKSLRQFAPMEVSLRDLLLMNRFPPSSAVIRREVFSECGEFDATLSTSEDRDMWIRIAARRRILLLNDPLTRLRLHADNASKKADRAEVNIESVLRKVVAANLVPAQEWSFWRRVWAFNRFQCALVLNLEHRRAEAVKEMARSLWLCPYFSNPRQFNEPPFFRVRSVARFFWP